MCCMSYIILYFGEGQSVLIKLLVFFNPAYSEALGTCRYFILGLLKTGPSSSVGITVDTGFL